MADINFQHSGLRAHAASLLALRNTAKATKHFVADFTHEVDGVPFEVAVEYEPSEPHVGAQVEVQRVRVEGSAHDIESHLDKATLAVLQARAEVLMDLAEKRRARRAA